MSNSLIFDTIFPGLKIIKHRRISDERGYFQRLFCLDLFAPQLNGKNIVQINNSVTRKIGVVRGLHFQYPPYAETKIVTCLRGKIWDVAVDLRKGSPTFLQHYSVSLSENQPTSIIIPKGFAHGFQTLTNDCELIYLHTEKYNSQMEGIFNAIDERLAIKWPIEITARSRRDMLGPRLLDSFRGLNVE